MEVSGKNHALVV